MLESNERRGRVIADRPQRESPPGLEAPSPSSRYTFQRLLYAGIPVESYTECDGIEADSLLDSFVGRLAIPPPCPAVITRNAAGKFRLIGTSSWRSLAIASIGDVLSVPVHSLRGQPESASVPVHRTRPALHP